MRTTNVVPSPSTLTKVMSPPSVVARFRLMAKPSPVPLAFAVSGTLP